MCRPAAELSGLGSQIPYLLVLELMLEVVLVLELVLVQVLN
jgi:hypothetical protein